MPSYAEENIVLREKIVTLEKERKALKAEIEHLRHEKNKTTIKKQVNLLEVGSPMDRDRSRSIHGGGGKSECDLTTSQLEKDVGHMEAQRRHEMQELQRKFEADCDAVRKQNGEYEEEVKALREKETSLEQEIGKIESEKDARKNKLQQLQAQLKALDLKLNTQKASTGHGDQGCGENCEHKQTVDRLKGQVEELEGLNTDILVKNEQAKMEMEKKLNDWTIREAEMSQAEEDFKVKLQTKWQEMYRKWMETTEAKMLELQQANLLLRRLLKPESGDHATGQRK